MPKLHAFVARWKILVTNVINMIKKIDYRNIKIIVFEKASSVTVSTLVLIARRFHPRLFNRNDLLGFVKVAGGAIQQKYNPSYPTQHWCRTVTFGIFTWNFETQAANSSTQTSFCSGNCDSSVSVGVQVEMDSVEVLADLFPDLL